MLHVITAVLMGLFCTWMWFQFKPANIVRVDGIPYLRGTDTLVAIVLNACFTFICWCVLTLVNTGII